MDGGTLKFRTLTMGSHPKFPSKRICYIYIYIYTELLVDSEI